jgi:hypothetical protein
MTFHGGCCTKVGPLEDLQSCAAGLVGRRPVRPPRGDRGVLATLLTSGEIDPLDFVIAHRKYEWFVRQPRRAAGVRRREVGACAAPASVERQQQRRPGCPSRCTRLVDGHLTPGTARCSPSRTQQRRSRYRSPARRPRAILRPTTNTTPPHHRRRTGRSRRPRAQRPPTAGHDVPGLALGAGRSESSPTSAIVLSQRAARRRRRDDPIALLIA